MRHSVSMSDFWVSCFVYSSQRTRHAIITPLLCHYVKTTSWRRFDVIMTLLLRHVYTGIRPLEIPAVVQKSLTVPCTSLMAGKLVNSLRPRRNRRHFADGIFKCIFLNENEWSSLRISLKFVPKVRINNSPSLVQIMAWCLPGDKPLSNPMVVSLLTHTCVTRPQWDINRLYLAISCNSTTQRAHDAILMWLLRRNDVATSFRRNNDIVFASHVRWNAMIWNLFSCICVISVTSNMR